MKVTTMLVHKGLKSCSLIPAAQFELKPILLVLSVSDRSLKKRIFGGFLLHINAVVRKN